MFIFEEDSIDSYWINEQTKFLRDFGLFSVDPMKSSLSQVYMTLGGRSRLSGSEAKRGYPELKNQFQTTLTELFSKVETGEILPDRDFERISNQLEDFYNEAIKYGAMRAGNPYYMEKGLSESEKKLGGRLSKIESKFLKRAINQLKNGESRFPSDVRAKFFAESLDVGFWNGFLLGGLAPGSLIHWRLGHPKTEHCDDCMNISENGPYTIENLPTVPRAGDTQCFFNCHCVLVIEKPSGLVTGSLTTISETEEVREDLELNCFIEDRSGGRAGQDVKRTISDLFGEMYSLRARIALEKDPVIKKELIKARQEVNESIINLSKTYNLRVVPKYSVKEIVTKANEMAEKGYALLKSVWRCP